MKDCPFYFFARKPLVQLTGVTVARPLRRPLGLGRHLYAGTRDPFSRVHEVPIAWWLGRSPSRGVDFRKSGANQQCECLKQYISTQHNPRR